MFLPDCQSTVACAGLSKDELALALRFCMMSLEYELDLLVENEGPVPDGALQKVSRRGTTEGEQTGQATRTGCG